MTVAHATTVRVSDLLQAYGRVADALQFTRDDDPAHIPLVNASRHIAGALALALPECGVYHEGRRYYRDGDGLSVIPISPYA